MQGMTFPGDVTEMAGTPLTWYEYYISRLNKIITKNSLQ